jgi:hypothetical protein
LGAGAAPKVLDGVEGTVFLGAAVDGADTNLGSAECSTCPGTALADSDDGSSVIEGTFCPLTASSPTTSLTLSFDYLGFGELALKMQEKGRNQSKSANKSTRKFRKSTYLDVSSPSPPGEMLTLRFRVVILGLFR